ncbi:MAG: sterol desaturase family protein [Pirellulales bacterium]|nr:sterol desaturase family protein [Pirellulales bacterium]
MLDLIDRVLGSDIPYITYAVPFFFILIGIEVLAARWEQKKVYRLHDSINDLSCGVLQVVSGTFFGTVLLLSYQLLYEHWAILSIAEWSGAAKWGAAIALFLGVDCCYYWFHRASHEMNAPWAAHAVHHQSEEYNLAVALRQGTFQPFFSWVFYLPLAIIGFPTLWYVAMSSFNTLYQFWIHTRLIKSLGPLEWILNTPSHHRVHHGRNLKYLDKNHAGTLIIWDRLFGTFQAEEEEPVYGIVRPLSSWNPLWANVHEYVELWEVARQAPYFTDKIKIWFKPPGWQPRGLPERPPTPDISAESVVKYHTRIPGWLNLYVVLQFVLATVMAVSVMASRDVPRWQLLWPTALVVVSLLAFGAVFERKPWAYRLEHGRLLLFSVTLALMNTASPWFIAISTGALLYLVASIVWLAAFRDVFLPEEPVVVVEPAFPSLTARDTTAASN